MPTMAFLTCSANLPLLSCRCSPNGGHRQACFLRTSTPDYLFYAFEGALYFEGKWKIQVEDDYKFIPGKDEIVVEGKAGYVVSFGEMLYRSWDAVLRCRGQRLDVGLIN